MKFAIPREIAQVTYVLEAAGFEAYLVGGCVRDLYRNVAPRDWDVTTNAKPEEIIGLFPKTFYENDFGTVGVVNEDIEEGDPEKGSMRVVEVTPYRKEGEYSDFRRPDKVDFMDCTLDEDLRRRDFTMNALAYSVSSDTLVDPFGGEGDIAARIIRTVGEPGDRFHEDALRILRAVRFSAELGFGIDDKTLAAIKTFTPRLEHVSAERIREEFSKIIMSNRPMEAIILMQSVGMLRYVAHELEEGIGCEQNGDHIYHVWEHNLRAVQHSADRQWPLHVRLAALLHDVGKPATRRWSPEKRDWTFYGHDVVGGRMARVMLERLRYPKDTIEKVSLLVRHHLFFSDIEKITLSAVRRIVAAVGPDLVWDLMNVRSCDRIGMGRPKETPYRLRKYHSMIEEAMRAPVSVGMLKIDGVQLMTLLSEPPSPRIGFILHALFQEVLDDPTRNKEDFLAGRAKTLATLSPEELRKLGEAGKEKKEREEEKEVEEIRKKYGVK